MKKDIFWGKIFPEIAKRGYFDGTGFYLLVIGRNRNIQPGIW